MRAIWPGSLNRSRARRRCSSLRRRIARAPTQRSVAEFLGWVAPCRRNPYAQAPATGRQCAAANRQAPPLRSERARLAARSSVRAHVRCRATSNACPRRLAARKRESWTNLERRARFVSAGRAAPGCRRNPGRRSSSPGGSAWSFGTHIRLATCWLSRDARLRHRGAKDSLLPLVASISEQPAPSEEGVFPWRQALGLSRPDTPSTSQHGNALGFAERSQSDAQLVPDLCVARRARMRCSTAST